VVVPPVSLPGWLVLPPGWLVPPPAVPLEPLPFCAPLAFPGGSVGGVDPLFPGDVGDEAGGVDGPGVPPPEPFDAPGPTGGVGFGVAAGGVGVGFGFGFGAGAAFGFRGAGAGFAAGGAEGLGAAAGASPDEAVGAPEGMPPDALAPSPAPSWPLPTSWTTPVWLSIATPPATAVEVCGADATVPARCCAAPPATAVRAGRGTVAFGVPLFAWGATIVDGGESS
jgi:hypothetical protein